MTTAAQRTEAAAPIRQRTRVAPRDVLPPEVVAYVNENFGEDGMNPTDYRAVLLMMERFFSQRAYREHRHHVMDKLLRAGKSIPEIAMMFDRTERTIWTWKAEMEEHFAAAYGLVDLREMFIDRIRDFHSDLAVLNEIIHAERTSASDKSEAIRAKRLVHGMMDQVFRQSGGYRAFNVEQLKPQNAEGARESERFLRTLETALLGSPETIEHQPGEAGT